MHLFNFYLNIFVCVDQVVLGSVFENDRKNEVLLFRFFGTETKQQVSDLSFWFENEIIDVVISNRFQKRNKTKRKFLFISTTKRNYNKKSKRAQHYIYYRSELQVYRKIPLAEN